MTLPLFFVHGCRSGSTLLMNLLAQNPSNHCTPTNDLSIVVANIQNSWTTLDGFRAQGLERLVPQMRSGIRGLMQGFYGEQFNAGKAVFDKSRDWLRQIELIEEILEQRATVILCIRDIRDTVASLEKLFRENQITRPSRNVTQQLSGQTVADRVSQFLAKDSMLGMSICAIKDCFEKGLDNRLIVVPYWQLIHDPIGVVSRIHEDCGLPAFQCNPLDVRKLTKENDEIHGRDYHSVRDSVDDSAVGRWRNYLPEDVAESLVKEYPSIQELAYGSYRSCSRGE